MEHPNTGCNIFVSAARTLKTRNGSFINNNKYNNSPTDAASIHCVCEPSWSRWCDPNVLAFALRWCAFCNLHAHVPPVCVWVSGCRLAGLSVSTRAACSHIVANLGTTNQMSNVRRKMCDSPASMAVAWHGTARVYRLLLFCEWNWVLACSPV